MKCVWALILTIAVVMSLAVLPAPAHAQYQPRTDELPGTDSDGLMKAVLIGAGIGLAVTLVVYMVRHGDSPEASADSVDKAALFVPGNLRSGRCEGGSGVRLGMGIGGGSWEKGDGASSEWRRAETLSQRWPHPGCPHQSFGLCLPSHATGPQGRLTHQDSGYPGYANVQDPATRSGGLPDRPTPAVWVAAEPRLAAMMQSVGQRLATGVGTQL